MKKILFILAAPVILILLITQPAVIASGCSMGLTLWYHAVLPSLLPFMIFSGLLVRTGMFRYLNRFYAPFLGRILRISEDGCYAVLFGFICGFPMGAKVIADLVREKHISSEEGSYLLGFCNNVSPAFFLNYVCLLKLGYASVPWKLVLLFYLLPAAYGIVTRPFYHFPVPDRSVCRKKQTSLHRMDFPMLDACIMDGFTTITRLGGYIMLFTILVQLLKLLPLSETALALLGGMLEISCGIDQITALSSLSAVYRTALTCACASFGGLCILAQTRSVLEGTPLRAGTWLCGRIFTALLIFLLLQLPIAVRAPGGCW
ncbi:MAG: transporter [Clostridiales bacterium]|nr:transporter [Clostridiales bacterium]